MNDEFTAIKLKISMLERTILDLGTQLYELKGSLEKSSQEKNDLKSTLSSLKSFLDKEDILKSEDFDEELALNHLATNEDWDEPMPYKVDNNDPHPKSTRKQKH